MVKINIKNHKASVLLVTLIILWAMLAIALSVSFVSVQEQKSSISSSKSGLAYQLAESGIEEIMNILVKNPSAKVSDISGISGTSVTCIASSGLLKDSNTPAEFTVELKDSSGHVDCDDSSKLVSNIQKIKSIGITSQDSRAIEAPVVFSAESSAPAGYHLTFSDEFSGPSINPQWNTDYMGKWGDTSGQFSFSNGILSNRGDGPDDYNSGALDTHGRFSQKYGWFETRFRSRIGSGMHSAFWLMPANDSYMKLVSNGGTRQNSNEAFEIDIFEQLGRDPHNNELTAHYGDSYDVNHQSDTIDYHNSDVDFTKEFHTMALEWLPDKLIWYLDGNEVFRSNHAPQDPFYIIASLYAHSGWTGPWDPDQIFPVYYDMDYIRVYQKN